MEALYPRLYIICIFGAEIYKYDGKKYYFASNGYGLKQENNEQIKSIILSYFIFNAIIVYW